MTQIASPTIRRIAIVNRGEPAMRFIQAAREFREERQIELTTIALYTTVDEKSLFVREADDRICIGPAFTTDPKDGQSKSTYLHYDRLERALTDARADAVWVGWGFVAEHPDFARLCNKLGITFLGPTAKVMDRLGDKIQSKLVAEAAKVPVSPWSNGPVETLDDAISHANRLGLPLMLKATAGGGGRGIRAIHTLDDLRSGFESARTEALKAFGNATMFLEKRVDGARHVEVQILADQHGNTWAVGVRDCSLQRRNQKVLEEAPSPVLSPSLESELKEASVRLAKQAGYTSAGTVEYLYDPASERFYFMEMNTRLQVEHTVTEMTTGWDLVKMQIRVALGERIDTPPPPTQGHAIEVRLNAEDPDNSFAPAPGWVERFYLPTGPGIRIDTGVREGDEISSCCDSMVAKLIVHGSTRSEALARLRRALRESLIVIRGGACNKAFLLELVSHPDVIANHIDIGWLDRTWAARSSSPNPLGHIALMQAALDVHDQDLQLQHTKFLTAAARGRPAVPHEIGCHAELGLDGQTYEVDVRHVGGNSFRLSMGGTTVEILVDRRNAFETWITCGQKRHHVVSTVDGTVHRIEVDGFSHIVSRDEGGVVRAPSPAVTLAIHCKVGDHVEKGDRLVVLEAMKTEMAVHAPCSGRVRQVLVLQHVQVAPGTPLVVIEPEHDASASKSSARLEFPANLLPMAGESPEAICETLLGETRRAVLGYALTGNEANDCARRRAEICSQIPVNCTRVWDLENEVLGSFADVSTLFRKDKDPISDVQLSSDELMRMYLRNIESTGKGLPDRFVSNLRRALLRYGVSELEPSSQLVDALILLHRADARATLHASHVHELLERKLQLADQLHPFATPEFRELLDHLIAATIDKHLPLNDLAREVRYRYFDRPLFEAARSETYDHARASLSRLLEAGDSDNRTSAMHELVANPQPLAGFLLQSLLSNQETVRHLALEVMLRRFYRSYGNPTIEVECLDNHTVVAARFSNVEGSTKLALATHAWCADLPRACQTAARIAQRYPSVESITVDIVTGSEDFPVDVGRAPKRIQEALAAANFPNNVRQVVFCAAHPEQWRTVHHFTMIREADAFVEIEAHRGIHPMLANRLELWRLENFHTRRLTAADDIYLFHAVAKDNPKDERLFAFVEVRDMTAVRDEAGHAIQLPHLERLYNEALAGIRDFQARRSARERLLWNRVILHVWPESDLTLRDMGRIAKRLAPPAKNLGLEKVVVRIPLRDPTTNAFRESLIHISNRVGTGMHLRIDEPSSAPIRSLSAYAQKVVRMRKLGLVYAYEVIRMLTPTANTEEAEFPAGTFQEFDIHNGQLLPVDRPAGRNSANVVVGTVTNFTTKIPEGMTRVIIVGDASKEMGALAEPECDRILQAINLAEQLKVPVEWFAVSSGAKIAMDVGTEGLDWVAKVIRRLVEFTQAGGEVNVIVCGVNVGGQSYWNAEATMLMHTRGILVMTDSGSMVLTGKRALEYSGGVSAEDNEGIGGAERIMSPNGQAQYVAKSIADACQILLRHYEYTFIVPGELLPRRRSSTDPIDRDISTEPHHDPDSPGFKTVGDVFSLELNPGRKKPFDIRSIMRAVVDREDQPLERWALMRNAENAVVWDTYLGGVPVEMIGIESRPLPRLGFVPGDGPDGWTGGTLFPLSSKKVARAINASSGNRPVVIVANLSGFDGSPESMRKLQLEYGAEIGRAVVNFKGPIVFCVISRYHGGAYVVFSRLLNDNVEVAAIEGSYASVIGGAPAAAVVFPAEVKARTLADARVKAAQEQLNAARGSAATRLRKAYDEVYREVYAEKQGEVADHFDSVHSIQRAKQVGSLQNIVPGAGLRKYLIEAVERGIERMQNDTARATPSPKRSPIRTSPHPANLPS